VELLNSHNILRDKSLALKVAKYINERCSRDKYTIMHVCGTHEYTITHFGIRSLIPKVDLRAGPGCPVCVASPVNIDLAVKLSLMDNVLVTTFGDMFKVRGSKFSLMDSKGMGGRVSIVYSIHDAVELARRNPDLEVVHFAIGFETTAPSTAAMILSNPPENFSIIPTHLLIPPAMLHLLNLGEVRIDGFICPGHVSTIIGVKPYLGIACSKRVPMVIAGFEPLDVLIGVAMLIDMINNGECTVKNEYTRAVRFEGNVKALEFMDKVFKVSDAYWRGIGFIPNSGLELRDEFSMFDARVKFDVNVEADYNMPPGCRCGDVLRGLIMPWECPLFAKVCTPENPVGPCMVSFEGSCSIAYKYGGFTFH